MVFPLSYLEICQWKRITSFRLPRKIQNQNNGNIDYSRSKPKTQDTILHPNYAKYAALDKSHNISRPQLNQLLNTHY